MIRKILYGVVVVLLLVVIGLVALISSLDSRVINAIEENLSSLTGTRVTVDDVDISIFSGKGELTGLRVFNPQGFSAEPALSLGRFEFEIDMEALSMRVIPVNLIRGDGTEIRVEKNPEGRINIEALYQNLKRSMEQGASDTGEPSGNEFNLKIAEFVLGEGSVTLYGFGNVSQEIKTPAITLEDIGGASGAPLRVVGNEILSGILSGIIRHTLRSGIQQWIENNTSMPESVKDLINKGLGSIR